MYGASSSRAPAWEVAAAAASVAAAARHGPAQVLPALPAQAEQPAVVLFVVGEDGEDTDTDGGSLDRALVREHMMFGDLFVVPVRDTYHNSARKMRSFYRQLLLTHVSFLALLKLDDHAVLMPEQLLLAVTPAQPTGQQQHCSLIQRMLGSCARRPGPGGSHCWALAPPPPAAGAARGQAGRGGRAEGLQPPECRGVLSALQSDDLIWWGNMRTDEKVDRRNGSRWQLSREAFAPDVLPVFASGTAHVMNGALVRWLGQHTAELDLSVWMEDAAHGRRRRGQPLLPPHLMARRHAGCSIIGSHWARNCAVRPRLRWAAWTRTMRASMIWVGSP
jgi:hypothetical protein